MPPREKGFERYISFQDFSESVVHCRKMQVSVFLEKGPDALQVCKDSLVYRRAADS